MANVVEVTDESFSSLVGEKDLAIVDIYASWCGNCRLFANTFEQFARDHSQYPFFKIDGDANPKFRENIDIDNLPFVAVFRKGEYLGGQSLSTAEAMTKFMKLVQDFKG